MRDTALRRRDIFAQMEAASSALAVWMAHLSSTDTDTPLCFTNSIRREQTFTLSPKPPERAAAARSGCSCAGDGRAPVPSGEARTKSTAFDLTPKYRRDLVYGRSNLVVSLGGVYTRPSFPKFCVGFRAGPSALDCGGGAEGRSIRFTRVVCVMVLHDDVTTGEGPGGGRMLNLWKSI